MAELFTTLSKASWFASDRQDGGDPNSTTPEQHEEKANQRATEVGVVGDAGAEEGEAREAGEEIQQEQTGDEIFCGDRYGHEHQGELGVGMEKTERDQEAVDCAGGAEHRGGVDLIEIDERRLHGWIRWQMATAVHQEGVDGGRRQS